MALNENGNGNKVCESLKKSRSLFVKCGDRDSPSIDSSDLNSVTHLGWECNVKLAFFLVIHAWWVGKDVFTLKTFFNVMERDCSFFDNIRLE